VRLVARLIVNYFASRRLVVDYFAYAARPGASTHRAARQAARRRLLRLEQDRRRRLRLRHASSCFGTSLVTRLVVDYFISRRLVVDYFAYAARLGASARRVAHRRLLRLARAHHRLLRLRRSSGCLGMSRGSSSGSSSTTLP
jgi:hypothetical protein